MDVRARARRASSPAPRTCRRSTRPPPGYDLIEEIGVDRIRANSLRQTQLLIDLADDAGFEVRSPRDPSRRGGTVTVHVPEFAAVHRELTERQILCDFRPDAGIRLGPHYFTSDDELRHAIEQIGDIVESGAYERHLGAVAPLGVAAAAGPPSGLRRPRRDLQQVGDHHVLAADRQVVGVRELLDACDLLACSARRAGRTGRSCSRRRAPRARARRAARPCGAARRSRAASRRRARRPTAAPAAARAKRSSRFRPQKSSGRCPVGSS